MLSDKIEKIINEEKDKKIAIESMKIKFDIKTN
jgi:hypothetical protein